ncbi:hypothetical protein N9B82_01905 [Saprospiraceae bacterium]|nr:hypothetical protein [Saprospiraceae bacterium]
MRVKFIVLAVFIGIPFSFLQAQEYYLDSTFRQSLNGSIKTEKYLYNPDFSINRIDKGTNMSMYYYPNSNTIEVSNINKNTDEKYGGTHYQYDSEGELLSEVFYRIDDNNEEEAYLGNWYTYNDDGLLTHHTFYKEYYIGYYEYYSPYSDISYEYNEDGNLTKETVEYYVDGLDITSNSWEENDLVKATRHYTSELEDIRDTTIYDVIETGGEWRALNKNYFTDVSQPKCDSLFYLRTSESERTYRKYSSDCISFDFGRYSHEYFTDSDLVPFDSLIIGSLDSSGNHLSYRERTLYDISLDESQGLATVTESRMYYFWSGEFDYEITTEFFYRKLPEFFEEISTQPEIPAVNVFPSPVNIGGVITSSYSEVVADQAIVTDQIGRVIKIYDLEITQEFFQFEAPPRQGIYFLTFYNLDERVTQSRKIIVL